MLDTFGLPHPHMTARRYTSFLAPTAPGPCGRVTADNYERLVEVKRIYDPGNLFRLNHNIDPAG